MEFISLVIPSTLCKYSTMRRKSFQRFNISSFKGTSSDGSPGGGPSLFLCAVGIGSVSGKDGAHVWGRWRTCLGKMAYMSGKDGVHPGRGVRRA